MLATLERAQRNSRGLAGSAVGPAIPLSPLQVDVDEGLWSGGARAAATTPPGVRAAHGMHGRAPRSPHAGGAHQAAVCGRQSPGAGAGPAGGVCGAGGWGTQSYAEQDIVTGRGEVWVARPLGDGSSSAAASDDWGMRTVAMDPRSPSTSRAPTAAMAALNATPETGAAAYGQALGRTAAERVHCAPHQQPPQRVPGTATDFCNWEEGVGSVASMVNRPHSRAACAVITSRALNLPMTTRWSRPTAVARRRCGASRRGKKRRRRWLAPTWRCKNKAETRRPQAAGGAFRVYGGRQPAADPLATGGGGR